MTYNVHAGVGVDTRCDFGRIRRIIDDERPHVVALQELDFRMWRASHPERADHPSQAADLASFVCSARPAGRGSSGIAVVTAFPVLHQQEYDLSYQSHREPRFCLRVDLEVAPGAVLHVFNCHLGLSARERVFQRKQMLSDAILLSEQLHHPVVLMGDFNDSPISVVHRNLRRHFVDAFRAAGRRWGPTFKAGPLPIRLDHIYLSKGIRVRDCWVRNDALARVASDHRPVIASLEVTWPATAPVLRSPPPAR
jgi:endonuclease/exonuclease/phosphatase family metal-dependent hydrolase